MAIAMLITTTASAQLASIDWAADGSADGASSGTLAGVPVTFTSTDGPANGGLVFASVLATNACSNGVPGIGSASVVNEMVALDWPTGAAGTATITFGSAVVNPYLIINFTDPQVETFDFDDGLTLALIDQDPAASAIIAAGNVVTTNGAATNNFNNGFVVRLTGSFTSITFATNINLNGTINSVGFTVAAEVGTLSIIQDTNPDGPQDFAFTGTGGLMPASFSLDDDADATLSNTQTYANILAGAYGATQTAVPGYALSSLSCVDPDGGTTTSTGTATATIDLDAGETVTCTFVNTPSATVTITQDTVPNGAQDFSYTAGSGLTPATFALDDDADATLSNTRTFMTVPVGSHTLTQTAVTGFGLTSITCTDPDGGTTTNLGTGSVVLDADAGETIACTFVNTAATMLTIIQDTVPDGPQDFAYTATGLTPATFSLDDDADATLSNTRMFSSPAAGSYTVTQTGVANYVVTSITCTDPDNGTTTSVSGGSAVIDLDAGEAITCTFVNSAVGSITIVHDTVPDGPQDFAYTAAGLTPAAFSLDDDTDATLSNTQTFTNVAAGSHTIAQTAVTGYTVTGITCVDPDGGTTTNLTGASAAIDLDVGEAITCTFVTTQSVTTPTLPQWALLLLALSLLGMATMRLR